MLIENAQTIFLLHYSKFHSLYRVDKASCCSNASIALLDETDLRITL